ncbi:PREDICTED: sarcalumenin isoform X2 [Acromyrmex echinatior]|uniref:Sarcalumenin n=1 Tax=Acromyrmex echinatior TaxID=103372 RepID=F4WNL6_ACREC|nr:PREDICTED: sarcalumenin isoform X2 [Acromyrmex echinatior]EGI64209.1 Sarcalumenin [Acromyrmex echinatior]
MTGARMRPALVVGLLLSFLAVALRGVQCEDEQVPSEDLCRPYIEKALKDLGTGSLEQTSAEVGTEIDQENDLAGDEEASPTSEEAGEAADDVSKEETEDMEGSVEESAEAADENKEATEEQTDAREEKEQEIEEEQSEEDATDKSVEISTFEEEEAEKAEEASTEAIEDEGEQIDSSEKVTESEEARTEEDEKLDEEKSDEETKVKDEKFEEEEVDDEAKSEEEKEEADESQAEDEEQKESKEATEEVEVESNEEIEIQQTSMEASEEVEEESDKEEVDSKTDEAESTEDQVSAEDEKSDIEEKTQDESAEAESEEKDKESAEDTETASSEDVEEETKSEEAEAKFAEEEEKEDEDTTASTEEEMKSEKEETKSEEDESKSEEAKSTEEEDTKTEEEDGKSEEEDAKSEGEENEDVKLRDKREIGEEDAEADSESTEEVTSDEEQEPTPEEDLIQEIEIPENLRPRDHINQLLKLDEENEEKERAIQREADIILRDLKRLYDNAIKPLETMYKYRDLSNRHFGDPEIFSKPLVLFMGPWSGGKSSIINYLLDIEYKPMSLRTGAEPSPAYFNIIMHGEEEEVLDGTQLAADWTFSGLQKFGQGLLDRLRGLRLNNKLLEKVNIVEIPGILEIRKQVQRLFPFNDACQWFIDRADIIFLVYDPAKLDVGPETEAILDQLKGREYQTRIILNKADQVKPEELMRVQGALIWNISPLMSSAEPPIMYSTSLWSLPYEAGAPIRLLYAQERAFLRDLRSAINKRVEHKIASARRFAVRVRNHAKMVDCYLTTYYNHKTFFGNKREISDKIIENPQDYHIYEGLSTLTNISRYDLPDPDVYRDFFRLNPLYDFSLLSSTCTYFRGCPINRLDVSIAYDLPELVGNYKKSVEAVLHENEGNSPPS